MKKNGIKSTGQEYAGKVTSVDLTSNMIRFLSECRLEAGDCLRVAGLEGNHPIRSLFFESHKIRKEIKRARVGVVVHAQVDQAVARKIAQHIGADVHRVLEPFGGS